MSSKIKLENNEGWFDLESCTDGFDIVVKVDELYSKKLDVFKTKNGNFITRRCISGGKVYFWKSRPEEIELWKNANASKYTFPPEEEQ